MLSFLLIWAKTSSQSGDVLRPLWEVWFGSVEFRILTRFQSEIGLGRFGFVLVSRIDLISLGLDSRSGSC